MGRELRGHGPLFGRLIVWPSPRTLCYRKISCVQPHGQGRRISDLSDGFLTTRPGRSRGRRSGQLPSWWEPKTVLELSWGCIPNKCSKDILLGLWGGYTVGLSWGCPWNTLEGFPGRILGRVSGGMCEVSLGWVPGGGGTSVRSMVPS